ncbi:hypothetical protein [Planococcus sp. ISL-109]|uniref:hypothetical protein n=1 Tax=Planococcus sp. ISL-109 TaxID=2819166 RepID=UPI001BEB4D1E|nr:hypothetical protein [Planococcus sp. ISL-109]MBT2581273.1 hypothetical protein [Planococcus sp. ISL-109]
MPLWASAAFTLILGSVAIQNIYVAFKPLKNGEKRELDEGFSYGDGPFAVLGLFFTFAFWCSEKFFPDRYQLLAFRMVSLLMAASLIGLIFLVWYADVVMEFLLSE